jgi:cell division protein FtsB
MPDNDLDLFHRMTLRLLLGEHVRLQKEIAKVTEQHKEQQEEMHDLRQIYVVTRDERQTLRAEVKALEDQLRRERGR